MDNVSQLTNLIKHAIDRASKEIGYKLLKTVRQNLPEATGTLSKTTQLKISKINDITNIQVIVNQPYAEKQDIKELYHIPLELGEKRIMAYFKRYYPHRSKKAQKEAPLYYQRDNSRAYWRAYWALRKGTSGKRTGRPFEGVLKPFAYNYSQRSLEQIEPYARNILEKALESIFKN